MKFRPLAAITLAVSACGPAERSVVIEFEPRLAGAVAACEQALGDVRFADLRFYVHDVVLIGPAGERWPVTLTPDGIWQGAGVALLDFEDGTGSCANGTPIENHSLRGTYAGDGAAGIAFDLGVPEGLNHADPLRADPPLGYTDMHWHWSSGYKFLRFAVETDSDGFFLHLGSARCEGTIGDIRGCRSPNRPHAELPGFDPGFDRVIVDLDSLVRGIDLRDGTGSGCMSGPAESECVAAFEALGLDPANGMAKAPAPLFRVAKAQ